MKCAAKESRYRGGARFALTATVFLCVSSLAQAQQRYERDWPTIDYAEAPLADPVSQGLSGSTDGLAYHPERGYLDAVLELLGIDERSQVLVFSKTSQKRRLITPEQPRALYFNDTAYVGFVQGGSSLEIAAMDPMLGPVFFELPQVADTAPELSRETTRCLRCHDSYSMTGNGTPRFMLSSVLAGEDGDIVSHEINHITDTAVPFYERWGGLYVTGTHGDMRHLGNLVVRTGRDLQRRDEGSNGNLLSLETLVDTSPYLTEHSDLVALLVLEHQVEVQNRIARSHYLAKTAIDEEGLTQRARGIIAEAAEDLLFDLLMVEEAPLPSPVEGTSGFAEYFQAQGQRDREGRSLRDLDLNTRTFRYPVSYLIYSEAFMALPVEVKHFVYQRLFRVLEGIESVDNLQFSARDRKVALDILLETHQEFAAFLDAH